MRSLIEVKRIDLWSLFKVAFFLYAALGLVLGFFYAFFMFIAAGIGDAFIDEDLPGFGLLGGVLGIILVPVLAFLYGTVGSVAVTIGGGILNLVMKATGGVKFDVDLIQPIGVPQPSAPPAMPPDPAPPEPGSGGPADQV